MPAAENGAALIIYGDIGRADLSIRSRDRTVMSSVTLAPGPWISGSSSETVFGKTNYFTVMSTKGIAVGDIWEYYEKPGSPSAVTSVVDVREDGVVVLRDYFPNNMVWDFSATSHPYARAKSSHVVDFSTFKSRLGAWLALPELKLSLYFADLNRLVQPLLVNTNPTVYSVQEAETKLADLHKLLSTDAAAFHGSDVSATMQSILESYDVPAVDEVDALIRTLTEKGADRALSLFLQGRFTEFFGLTIEETSYAGTFQKTMREIAREDLAVSKIARTDSRAGHLEASIPSPDFEYDFSDIDPSPTPDVPA